MIKTNTDGKNQQPLYCLSFSPNWNMYQIISVNKSGLLVYGSNAESFLIDISNKSFISSVKPSENIPNSQLKVTSVLLDESLLFVGYSNGSLYTFNHKLQHQIVFKTKVSENQIMHIIQKQNLVDNLGLTLIDSEGKIFELAYIEGNVKVSYMGISCQSQVVKCCEFFSTELQRPLLLTIGQKGLVKVWDLKEKTELFSYNTNNAIYKADYIMEDEQTLTCALIAKKDFLLIIRLNLKAISQKVEGVQQMQTYPAKLHFQIQSKNKGDSEVLSAKPDVLFVNKNKLLISGKTGELFLIPIKNFEHKQELELKHLSAETDSEPLYEVVERNPHYKQIYAMNVHYSQNSVTLMTLGIDRRLSFWKYEGDDSGSEISPLWAINFLGGKARKITTSNIEKNKVFLTCLDKTMRIWDLERKNNKFSTQEIYKQLSQTQIFGVDMHPSCEGICVYSTEDTKICKDCLFDTLNHVCFKVLKIEKGIKSVQWVHRDLSEYFINFASTTSDVSNANNHALKTELAIEKEEGEEEKVNVKHHFAKTSDPKFSRTVPEDYVLFAVLNDNYLMILGINDKVEFYHSPLLVNQDTFSYFPIQLNNTYNCALIATGAKDGRCSFWKSSGSSTNLIASFKYNVYHISSIKFYRVNSQSILCATSSHDRKIIIYEINLTIDNEDVKFDIQPRILLKHKNKIEEVKWSLKGLLLAISHQDKTVQIWDGSVSEEDRDNSKDFQENAKPREFCNIRGHDGYITDATFSLYDENTVITASDDQTVKVWNINKIEHKSAPNPKKKNKKKKQKNKAETQQESDEPNLQKKVKTNFIFSEAEAKAKAQNNEIAMNGEEKPVDNNIDESL